MGLLQGRWLGAELQQPGTAGTEAPAEAPLASVTPVDPETMIPTFSLPEPVTPESLTFPTAGLLGAQQEQGLQLQQPSFPTFAPASVAPLTRARKTLEALPGQFQQATQAGMQRIRGTTEQVKQAAQQHAEAVGRMAAEQAGALKTGLAAIDQVRQEYQQRVDTARQQVESKMAEYQAAKQKLGEFHLDPNRVLSGGNRAVAALAVAFGAMGSALSRTPNTALAIVNGAIQRDLEAQRAEMAKRKQMVGAAMNEVQLARQLFADERSQQLAAEAMAWDRYAKQAQVIGLEHKSPVEQAKAGQFAAAAEQRAAELENQLQQNEAQLSLQAGTAALSGAQAEVGARQRAQEFRARQALTQQQQRAVQAKAKVLSQSLEPPGLKIAQPQKYMPTKDDKKKAQQMRQYYGMTYDILNDLIKQRETFKLGARVSPKKREELMATFNRLKSVMRKLDETGARIDPGEIEMMGLPADPKDWIGVLPRLKKVRELITRATLQGLMPYGYTLSGQAPTGARKVSK